MPARSNLAHYVCRENLDSERRAELSERCEEPPRSSCLPSFRIDDI
jgi:hypothetical protein